MMLEWYRFNDAQEIADKKAKVERVLHDEYTKYRKVPNNLIDKDGE